MKILHIPQRRFGIKNAVSGIKNVLLEEIKWENKIENIESKILIYDKIEEKNSFVINKKSLKEDILDYNPDFIIFDGFWAIQHCFIARFLRKKNIKYYIKPHGAFNKAAQKNSKIKFLKKIIARILIFNNYVKNSNGLIFLNETEKKNSIFHKKNEFILPNGVEKLETKIVFKEKKENLNFIFLGRIDIFNKKLDILFETLIKNKKYFIKNNIYFNFYGIGNDKNMKIFNKYLSSVSEFIRYHGTVYGNEKYKRLQENDIFILLSRFEGMPMGILEALSVGIPCFVSEETGMSDYIEKYDAGWVNKNGIFQDLKNIIFKYSQNKDKYIIKTQKCIELFYWEKLIKRYEDTYNKILRNTRE